jgi:hypothetical protein
MRSSNNNQLNIPQAREAGSVGGYDYIAYALTLSLSSTYCESAHVIKIAAVSTAAIFTND